MQGVGNFYKNERDVMIDCEKEVVKVVWLWRRCVWEDWW